MDSLNYFIDSWLKYLNGSRGLSINTIEAYKSDIKQLILFLQNYKGIEISMEHMLSLEKSDVRGWFLYRKNLGESTKTISRGISSLKSLLKYLINENILKDSEIITMKPPKIEKSLPRPLSITQINDILFSVIDIKQTDWIIKRDKSLLVLIYSVGLRISEALNLNRADISNSIDSISILGKGGKIRLVPIIASVRRVIEDYITSCKFKVSEALFVNNRGNRLSASAIQKLVKKSRELLGLSNKVTPHALRHSCATHLMENTGDLRGIQELLGHSSISSTQIYADVAKKYIADIYDKCHPLSDNNEKE